MIVKYLAVLIYYVIETMLFELHLYTIEGKELTIVLLRTTC